MPATGAAGTAGAAGFAPGTAGGPGTGAGLAAVGAGAGAPGTFGAPGTGGAAGFAWGCAVTRPGTGVTCAGAPSSARSGARPAHSRSRFTSRACEK